MKIINIKNRNEALKTLEHYQKKEQSGVEIKFINVHLCKINYLVGEKIFSKNDLYVMGETLYDVMQPVGLKGKHHHNTHGLAPKEVLNALNYADKPIGIYGSTYDRFVVVTIVLHKLNNLVLVIEKDAPLKNDRNAKINKLVSIYPRRDIENLITKHKGFKL